MVSTSGHIPAAAHVAADATRVSVITTPGPKPASVVRVDESNDPAEPKPDQGVYPALPGTPSRRVRSGRAVATIGFPHIEIQGFSPKGG